MEKEFYTCQFCQEKYKPKRRGVQKFCSSTCRTKNYYHKLEKKIAIESKQKKEAIKKDKTRIGKMSAQGVGNAAAGSLIADGVIGFAKAFQSEEKKPATKGDIDKLKRIIEKRHLPITNYNDPFGRQAFYDKVTCQIVLFNKELNKMELPFINS